MRHYLSFSALKLTTLCLGLATLTTATGHAQVTANFDNLPKTPATKPGTPTRKHTSTTYHRPTVNIPKGTDAKTFADTPLPPRKAPVLPALRPMWMPETTHPDIPPFKVDPESNAVTPILKLEPSGYKVCFAPQGVKFGTNAYNFLTNYALKMGNDITKRVVIRSFATGAADDPSLPRRMAFARALDVRSIFMNQGVPATRIYAQALGLEPTKTNCPDRVEIIVEQDPIRDKQPDNITALINPSEEQKAADKRPSELPADPALTPNVNPFKVQ